jgi:uncharacterized protein
MRLIWKLAISLVLVTACVSVNIYFPAAAANRAADKIIDDIEGADKAPAPPPAGTPAQPGPAPAPKPGSALPMPWKLVAIGPAVADAAEMDLDISSPAIRTLRDSLHNRYQQLLPYFESGVVGLTNKGLIGIRDASNVSLKDKATLNGLVEQQNQDLRSLFQEIVKANKMDSAAAAQIQKIFADRWRERAKPGRWIQTDAGAWVKK